MQWSGHRQAQLRDGAVTLLPNRAGKWTVSLSLRADNLYQLDRATQQAVPRARPFDLPTAEFEAGGEAREPLRIEIDADARARLAERLSAVKDLLGAAEQAKADAARK